MMCFRQYLEIIENPITTTKQSSSTHHAQLITVIILINYSVIPPLWVSLKGRAPEVESGFTEFSILLWKFSILKKYNVEYFPFQHQQSVLITVNNLLNVSLVYASLTNLRKMTPVGVCIPVTTTSSTGVSGEVDTEEDQKSSKSRSSRCPYSPKPSL